MSKTRRTTKTAKTAAGGNTPLVAFRFPEELTARLDAYVVRYLQANPGRLKFTRADAVRELLTHALDAADKRQGKG